MPTRSFLTRWVRRSHTRSPARSSSPSSAVITWIFSSRSPASSRRSSSTYRARMALVRRLAIALALFFLATPAAAQEKEEKTEKTIWYGWQTLSVDAAGVGLCLATGVESPYIVATLAGAPAVHFFHGHQVRALVDFGVRVVVPLGLGLVVGGPYDPAPIDAEKKYDRFLAGAIIGAVLASAFDAVVLGRETVQIPKE